MIIQNSNAEFLTVTCLEWKHILKEDRFKSIITESLGYLTKNQRIRIYGFVIMSNHFHLIWQMINDHRQEDVRRDFLKFTSQQILKHLRNEASTLQEELLVNAKDRKHQVWERNSLGISISSNSVLWQKLDYIHQNPVKAGLCELPEDYKYSSAGFYLKQDTTWGFLAHPDG